MTSSQQLELDFKTALTALSPEEQSVIRQRMGTETPTPCPDGMDPLAFRLKRFSIECAAHRRLIIEMAKLTSSRTSPVQS
jgi:hypothetical protein